MTRFEREFRDAVKQRDSERVRPERGSVPVTRDDEIRLHVSLAKLTLERGHPVLADLYLGHARVLERDCRPGCKCSGCEATRAEAQEWRERKAKRAAERGVAA